MNVQNVALVLVVILSGIVLYLMHYQQLKGEALFTITLMGKTGQTYHCDDYEKVKDTQSMYHVISCVNDGKISDLIYVSPAHSFSFSGE